MDNRKQQSSPSQTQRSTSPRRFARASVLVSVIAAVELLSLLAVGTPDQDGPASDNVLFAALGVVSFVALVGLTLWLARDAAAARRDAALAGKHSEVALRRQHEAEMCARIAGELHDSVGHDLTAIIALTEAVGWEGGDWEPQGTGQAQPNGTDTIQVLRRVNELAREGLADTRRAVAALEAAELHNKTAWAFSSERCNWDRIPSLVAEVRMAGKAAPYSEVGARPEDLWQAELAYRVVREGITNALRHAEGTNCIAVSLEHAADGSCCVAVRDDGEGTPAGAGGGDTPSGKDSARTGLRRLAGRVEVVGGTFNWGPDEGGWSIEATIPPSKQVEGR